MITFRCVRGDFFLCTYFQSLCLYSILTINKREIIAEGPTSSVYDLSAKRFELMSHV
jgi:hypothetical protein